MAVVSGAIPGDLEPLEDVANSGETTEGPGNDFFEDIGVPKSEILGAAGEDTGLEDSELGDEIEAAGTGKETDVSEGDIDSQDLEGIEGEEDEELEEPEAVQEAEAEPKPGSAQARIRNLVAERKQLQTQMEQQNAQFQQYYQQSAAQAQQQYQAQLQEMQKQNEVLAKQMELIQGRKQVEDEENMSPLDKLKSEMLGKAKDALGPEIAALRKELDAERAHRAQAIKNQKARANLSKFEQATKKARMEHILPGFDESQNPDFAGAMDDMLLSYIAAKDVDPEIAGPQFQKYLDNYYRWRLGQNSKQGAKIKESRKIPAVSPAGKSTTAVRQQAAQEYRPTWAELGEAGYDDFMEWREDGAPILSQKK